MKLLLSSSLLAMCLTGCSKDTGTHVENRLPGNTPEQSDIEGRVRALELIAENNEQGRIAAALSRETGIVTAYLPGNWGRPACLSMARKGSDRYFYFCGARLLEGDLSIKALDTAGGLR